MKCNICPRHCNINRENAKGFCGMPSALRVALADLFFYEEPVVSGKNGSGTIFFSGCNMHCVFCQNNKISAGGFGKEISTLRLAHIMDELYERGAHNINLVSPTQYSDKIIEALDIYKPPIPIIYNTNGYETIETLQKLAPYIDVYLTDLKYVSADLSTAYSATPDYFAVAQKAVLEMVNQQPDVVIKDELIERGVIVRHLVLPDCTDDSLAVTDWIKRNLGDKVLVSIMGQYVPCNNLERFPNLQRALKPIEYKLLINHLIKINLTNGFVQELDSSNRIFIPNFNLQNV